MADAYPFSGAIATVHPKSMTFETEPGLFITADAWGDPAHPPVLLLHGGGQTRHSWGDTGRWLADAGWYALAPDARGHGDSNWSAEGHYGIEFLASDLRAICAHLDQKPALVGASMGGMTALIAEGERAPGAASICSAVVLVDIAPRAEQKGIERIFAFMSRNQDGFASLDEAAEAVAAYLPHRSNETRSDETQSGEARSGEPRNAPPATADWRKTCGCAKAPPVFCATTGTGTQPCWPFGNASTSLPGKARIPIGCIGPPAP